MPVIPSENTGRTSAITRRRRRRAFSTSSRAATATGRFRASRRLSLTLGAQCRGAFAAYKTDGSVVVFAATSTDLYQLNNTTYGWTKFRSAAAPMRP
jgi:hypothetical protein